MKVSIIVPAFNEEKLIAETLRRIQAAAVAFSEAGFESELIVCDNNSNDRTAELAQAAGAQVVFEPINQIARARNKGAEAATGDWLLFIDADSHPSPGLYADVAAAIRTGRCLAGGSTVRLDDSRLRARVVAHAWNAISRCGKWLAGSFIFCEAAAFRQIGGFNLKFFVSEELDLTRRLKKLAAQSRKRIVVLHRHPLTTSARKLDLYSHREHLRFLGKTVFRLGRTFNSAEECHIWYDGRR
jgi:glycosyltransferase involved in cell wall biosynthesis